VKPVLLDTGVVVALLDRSEQYHTRCADAIEELEGALITCEAVIAESCYLSRRIPGAAETILKNVSRGVFHIPFQLGQSAAAVGTIMRKYRDQPADFADACLIYLADDVNTGEILTLDRDFMQYRWRKTRRFELLIDL
jgi:predicted nucleic acid-binding protein